MENCLLIAGPALTCYQDAKLRDASIQLTHCSLVVNYGVWLSLVAPLKEPEGAKVERSIRLEVSLSVLDCNTVLFAHWDTKALRPEDLDALLPRLLEWLEWRARPMRAAD